MATTPSRDRIPLMLIHGAWLAANSWDNFAEYFESRGFGVSAPEWPRKHGGVEELERRRRVRASAGGDRRPLRREIRALDEPPVLIGHSFGGLIVELAARSAVSPSRRRRAPLAQGHLVLPFSSLKAAAPALAHPSKWKGRRHADSRSSRTDS